jgi:hypothetical protein
VAQALLPALFASAGAACFALAVVAAAFTAGVLCFLSFGRCPGTARRAITGTITWAPQQRLINREVFSMPLQFFAVLVLGLMCGSELNVAAFAHPTFNHQPRDVQVVMRSSFAALLGRVMPFWMTGSTVLNILLLLPFAHLSPPAWRLALIALVIQVLAVVFSLVGPVPINNRIAKWTPESLPNDWRAQEHRWDLYHWLRTSGLIVAFAILLVSLNIR